MNESDELKARYREDVAELRQLYPRKSKLYEDAHRERQDQLAADLFELDGELEGIYRPQRQFAGDYFRIVKRFYDGEIDDEVYRRRRLELLREYAERLHRRGLLSAVFGDEWIRDFSRRALLREREIAPVGRMTGDEAVGPLCDPLREFSKEFFRRLHSEFGVGRLARSPEIFGGIDSSLCDAEAKAQAGALESATLDAPTIEGRTR